MSLLSIKHIFGVESSLPNCIFYLDEHCYLYPSSRHIILYNIDYKSQRLISYGNQFDKLELLSVSPNKQYLGIALNRLNKCDIIIYDISGTITTPIQKRKILSLKQTIRSIHVLSLVFSTNSKFLLALYGAPDHLLVCWSIDRLKSIGNISLHIDLSYHPLNLQVSFNPIDSSEMLITGNHMFQRYRLNNGYFSAHDHGEFERYQSMNITCHCWLNENEILLGLKTGFICTVNKHGDILQGYNVYGDSFSKLLSLNRRIASESNPLLYHSSNGLSSGRSSIRSRSDINIKNKKKLSKKRSNSQFSSRLIFNKSPSSKIDIEENEGQQRSSSRSLDDNRQMINHNDIVCLLPFSRGVFVSTGTGRVLMYQRNENSAQLTYLRTLMLPSSTTNDFSSKKIEKNFQNLSMELHERSISNEVIQSLALSPHEETLLVGTNNNHLYQFSFSKIDYTKKEANIFTHALDAAHTGAIITGALCIRKPILFTLGIDRYLKIWNLQTNNQELNDQFVDEPLSISIHPTGIFLCIAFSNIVRIYTYTIHGLTLFKQLEISNARIIEYSNQGHILAIAYHHILQLHPHNDYHQITYAGPIVKKFRLIRWTRDDAFIISVHFDDLVIRWDPYTGQLLSQYPIRDFSVQDLLISSDNKFAYLLGSDQKVKEFLMMTTIRDINIPFDDCIPTALAVNDQTRTLFIGSQKGSIYSIKLTQSNSIIDTSISHHLLQINVHQGPVTKILISFDNDLIISMGEDGNVITYYLNNYQQNKESKRIFRDEILVKEILLKEQNIELNNLIKHELEIAREYENKIKIKEEEYIEHFRQLDLHCQSHINAMQNKLMEFRQKKGKLKTEDEEQLNELIRDKQNSINEYLQEKNKHYKEIVLRDQLLKSKIENLKINENEERDLSNDFYQGNIQLIHLSYRDKLKKIKNKFFQERLHINERIDHLQEIKDVFDEDTQNELTNLHENYQTKFFFILNQIEQLENEEVLLKTRLKQVEEESNRYENQIKQFQIERNQLIDHIQQIQNEFYLAKQTIEQRHFIIHQKLKRTNEMENRRDQLEKFAYVFNYKIGELSNEIDPRQHQIKALIELFNNMDNEYDLLTKNNEKYSIKIDDYKARLRAIEKELRNETLNIRKLNQTIANIKEDFKLCSHFIDQPKQLIEMIRKIYGKYFLYIQTNINFDQMNLFDCVRQRSYFERTNRRLQTKISFHFKKEKIEQIKRIEEQINIMREISSYSLKLVQLETILSDLDIVSNISIKINATTTNQIIHALQIQQDSHFIQEKQLEFNSILNKQQKRIQQLTNLIRILEQHLQQTLDQFTFYPFHQLNIISSNSIYSQTSNQLF